MEVLLTILPQRYPEIGNMSPEQVADMCRTIHSTLPSKLSGRKAVLNVAQGDQEADDMLREIADMEVTPQDIRVVPFDFPVPRRRNENALRIQREDLTMTYGDLMQTFFTDDKIREGLRRIRHQELIEQCTEDLDGIFIEGEGCLDG
jgi:hypothetical protein